MWQACHGVLTFFTDQQARATARNSEPAQAGPSLSSIAARLAAGGYAAPAEVQEDVRRVWQACHAAYAPGSEAAKACDELSGYVDQLWRQVMTAVHQSNRLRR